MKYRYTVISIIFFALINLGCNQDKAIQIEGMTLDDWSARLDSDESVIRLDALDAIKLFGRDAIKLKHKLTLVARYDTNNDVKYKAVLLIEELKLSTDEFNDFMDLYDAPLIPVTINDDILYSTINSKLGDKSSVMDDLIFLQGLSKEVVTRPDNGVLTVPSDPSKYDEFVNTKRSESIDDLIQMLNNPDVLMGLMKSGDQLEKSFALDKLTSFRNLDPKIAATIKKISSSMGKGSALEDGDIVKLLQQP
jgi:hypothetical protein